MIQFDNSYARLPERFFTRQGAKHVTAPKVEAWNDALAKQLGFDGLDAATQADWFGGNTVPPGADPLAQVYAGHQFGGWSPQLGDGRALLLGEVVDEDGARWDVQLKGSGPTPYSRRGDGLAWLGPVIREYLVSEAMAALDVPTTRALAIVSTGDTVYREAPLPGAVLTRVASSHLRVGTFQFFAARDDVEALEQLARYALERHYSPEELSTPDVARQLLTSTVEAQANLIARWMGLGFVHGVMNTDNAHIGGITIDYGPCAFIDRYHPMAVYSSIDHGGRYAFGNQPNIAAWNMAQLATALLPLMPDRDAAIEEFTDIVNGFTAPYQAAWRRVFGAKVGLVEVGEPEVELIQDLLTLMAKDGADFTNTFRALKDGARDEFTDREAFDAWEARWRPLADTSGLDQENPAVIPRTHRIEEAISAAVQDDWAPFWTLHTALQSPFDVPEARALMSPPTEDEIVPATFCGT